MIIKNEIVCPKCGGELKYYDRTKRIMRIKYGKKEIIYIRRFRCLNCNKLHRELPDCIFPYKQYDAEIIRGVLEGFITGDTLGFENYPCEMTMLRWKASQIIQCIL